MKVLKSAKMKSLLARGVKKAKKKSLPPDGTFVNLIYETATNGWHYQVEYIHDTSEGSGAKRIQVYAFKPSFAANNRNATHTLWETL